MFTYDPTFDPAGPRAGEVQSWCQANWIRRDQIYCEKSTRKYCKESQAQVVEYHQQDRQAAQAVDPPIALRLCATNTCLHFNFRGLKKLPGQK